MSDTNITINELYVQQTGIWNRLNNELFGLSANINMSPFFINETLKGDADRFWNHGTCALKRRFLEDGALHHKEHMVPDTWSFEYNPISNAISLYAFFIFTQVNGRKIQSTTAIEAIKQLLELDEGERREILSEGVFQYKGRSLKVARYRVAFMPLVTSLGYLIKNNNQALRIKATPNDFLLRKIDGVVKQKDWKYEDGKFYQKNKDGDYEAGPNPFDDIHELNYPFLNAILGGKQVTKGNLKEALDLMPEYDSRSVLYFSFAWFDEVYNNIIYARSYSDPQRGKYFNCYSLMQRRNQYANLKTKDLYTNLIQVKNDMKALEVSRNIVWVPVADYIGEFAFHDTENLFDAFKTPTSGLAGRTRLLLDDVYVEDGMLKIDRDGKTYTQYDIILGNMPIPEHDSNLSCLSRVPFNYLNDAKRIMFCSKLRSQSVQVKGQLEDFTHEVPCRVVFADWKGFNFGDSFVVSESFAKKMERDITQVFTTTKEILHSYEVGQELTNDDLILISKRDRYSSWRDVHVTRIFDNQMEVTARIPFGVGDKISNMHGSKGIVSVILPDEDMPYLTKNLSENMPEGPVDIIVPGVSVFRRKSVGQMFEAVSRALGIPEMPLDELKEQYGKQIAKFDRDSIFSFEGKEFHAPCGINNFIRLDHDSHSKQSFAYVKTNHRFNLSVAEMELLNLSSRGLYNILNELDIRSLNKHLRSVDKIKDMQTTGNVRDEAANNQELYDYFKFLGWLLSITGSLESEDIDARWEELFAILDNEELSLFD